MTDLTALTILEAHALLTKGEISAVQLAQAHLDRIAALDDKLNAFLTVTAEIALDQARRADKRRKAGEDHPLLGAPMVSKDVLCTEGVQTTCGSKILAGYRPPYTATAVARLAECGVVMLGKTNMDEFAMGSSNENSAYGPVHNPWDLDRVPGGSSGGSAAAVAARMAPAGLGTDTGGSIRQPAALTGIVGVKTSYGRVSRYGLVAFASSLDQVGPFARTVEDAALVLGVIAGHDPLDSTSMDVPVPDYRAALKPDLKGVKVGIPREYMGLPGMQSEVGAAVEAAIQTLRDLGAETREISL